MISCKGFCDMKRNEWKKPPSNGLPYLTHGYCRNCAFWVNKDDAWMKVRCPCCHGRMSFRPRESWKKRKYGSHHETD